MTKIDLITGILGAGKTTFLLRYGRYLLQKGERIAIIVNDFGAVTVDMLLLQELKGENCEIVTICGCGDPHASRRRFKTQLINMGMQHFDRVIIEPSGIFDIDEFFDTLYESPLDRWYEIGSVLTIIDAEMDDYLGDQMEYLLGSEAACAGKLIVSKLSTFSEEKQQELLEKLLCHVNHALYCLHSDRRFMCSDALVKPWNTLSDADFAMLEGAGYRKAYYVKMYNARSIHSGIHYFMHLQFPEAKIEDIIRQILGDVSCGQIYRIKGSLPSDDGGWRKVNATRERADIQPIDNGQSVLIAIGDNLNRERIDTYFRAVNRDPEYVSI